MRVDLSVSAIVLAGIALALLLALPFVSSGFFSIDEFIYYAGADALFRDGSLFVDNGFYELGSENLKIWFLVQGSHGLTPQYPVGTAIIGAPFLFAFGEKGLIVLNVLAGIGTLFATRSLAKEMFGRAEIGFLAALILVIGTFWPEYIFGHWPHSVSLFFVTVSLLAFFKSLDRPEYAMGAAIVSGLTLGAAMLFRLDSILALPAYLFAIILYGQRPVALIVGGALGLVPAVILIAVTNLQKFGTLNPLSYGRVTGGSTDASSHVLVAGVFCLAFLAVLAIRLLSTRGIPIRRVGFAALAIIAAAFAVPITFEFIRDLGLGFVRLFVDATEIAPSSLGVVHSPDGTASFWGFPKKALAQSLPWLGILFLVIFRSRVQHTRSMVVAMIFLVVWMLPFLESSWHGGLGSNMRYFLPMLPVLASTAAYLIFDLFKQTKNAQRILAIGWTCGVVLVFGWAELHPSNWFGAHQIFPTLVFYLSAFLILLAGLLSDSGKRTSMTTLMLAFVGAGIGVSSVLAISDFHSSQTRRAAMDLHSRNAGTVHERALFYGAPERFASAISNREHIVALPNRLTGEIDTNLINDALDAGFVVLMPPQFAKAPDIADNDFIVVENARWTEMSLVQILRR